MGRGLIKRGGFIFLAVVMLTALSAFASAAVLWTADANGDEQSDYEPGAIVYVYGSGFAPNSEIEISITRPDGSVESCDAPSCHARFLDGFVFSDSEGDVLYRYDLDGIVGFYEVELSDGSTKASGSFTDGRNILNVTVDGGTSTIVGPSGPVTVAVTVHTSGSGSDDNWRSTRYRIEGGSWTCVNTPDHTSDGTYTESFVISAPGSLGTYDLSVRAYQGSSCSGDGSNTYTLEDAIVVQSSAVCGDGEIDAPEQCDDGDTQSGDGCSGSCLIETGWHCHGEPSTCSEICGDGLIVGDEECDDDDTHCGDGCSSTCEIEDGWVCEGEPSFCTVINPELNLSCGLDVIFIMDSSGSISNDKLNDMKDAFKDFVDSVLVNSPSQAAVVDFDDTGHLILDYTSNISAIKGAIDSVVSGGATNWEDALEEAHEQFDNRPDYPDLYILASDGHPNRIGDISLPASEVVAVAWAVEDANAIKLDGIRIVTLGLGDAPNTDSMKAISSDDAYYEDLSILGDELQSIQASLCKATLTVRKVVDGEGHEGWNFTADVMPGEVDPVSAQTDSLGYATFNLLIGNMTGVARVEEQDASGFQFVNASCVDKDGNPVGVLVLRTVQNIFVSLGDEIYCEFVNKPCEDDDGDGVCNEDDSCPDSMQNEPVDEDGCDIFQFCSQYSCGLGCFEADWRSNEPNVRFPHDCMTVVQLNNGMLQNPICVPTVFSEMCAG
ncbi:MAG: VWA domain-containing protein [Nanoarchaeota archaeon]|nr:VWA domain-containing protein [Nanoarchaeota archaeon]MBU0977588.1 VWA domain-containing protein [Nanoarchaeota archaeon]